ncbi:uncharacterized protein M421DRAFT_238903 [Didymella exigua CBS 183.55]|uniref:Uncharacterized protein n=1 Tax=Didymella exigua CBS 183.55 TaxID=1150837 RepID=A0A6A5REL9_9PLEO|nr:uncharacterized protein M421DRAFT_238903 [Didymella exigua CBS 183.55]KAF1925544.1 hypothetical protein M421DRAFT_238903 [Didymella exigua CBS 183.55]
MLCGEGDWDLHGGGLCGGPLGRAVMGCFAWRGLGTEGGEGMRGVWVVEGNFGDGGGFSTRAQVAGMGDRDAMQV